MIFAIPSFASDWFLVSDFGEVKVWLDRDSIRDLSTQNKIIKRFSVNIEHIKLMPFSENKSIAGTELESKIYCSKREIETLFLGVKFSDGTKEKIRNLNEKRYFPPGSFHDGLYRYICK